MNIEIKIPDMGSEKAEVTEILVQPGDKVEIDQPLLVVEGDKASMEVPAEIAGTVKEIKVSEGDLVQTGTPIMLFEVESSESSNSADSTETPAASGAQDKKVAPATTPEVQIETVTAQARQTSIPVVPDEGFSENSAYAHASPAIRRLAREFGINLSKVQASGRKGRVVKEDVQNYVKQLVKQGDSGGGLNLIPWPEVDFAQFGEIEEKRLSRIQRNSGANLHRNWVQIPHVTQYDEADITKLEAHRKEQNIDAQKQKSGVKITPLVFVMKAAAKTLLDFPTVNASIDGKKLILKKYINIGVAVDTPNGLIVPVFKNVSEKNIIELSRELMEVSQKARDGKLTPLDMQGGCFTISSLGGIGGTAFTPIINAPEIAILGVSKSEMKPKWNGEIFEPKLMVPLSLSYDHRVIDGALAARFIVTLSKYLSEWTTK